MTSKYCLAALACTGGWYSPPIPGRTSEIQASVPPVQIPTIHLEYVNILTDELTQNFLWKKANEVVCKSFLDECDLGDVFENATGTPCSGAHALKVIDGPVAPIG